jgi:hypothetical protein
MSLFRPVKKASEKRREKGGAISNQFVRNSPRAPHRDVFIFHEAHCIAGAAVEDSSSGPAPHYSTGQTEEESCTTVQRLLVLLSYAERRSTYPYNSCEILLFFSFHLLVSERRHSFLPSSRVPLLPHRQLKMLPLPYKKEE